VEFGSSTKINTYNLVLSPFPFSLQMKKRHFTTNLSLSHIGNPIKKDKVLVSINSIKLFVQKHLLPINMLF
jgi:hypothetical protein